MKRISPASARQLHPVAYAAALALTTCVGAAHAADQEGPPATSAEPEKATMELVVVSGFRRSLDAAIDIKRREEGITDSITSDGMGRFATGPGLTAA